MKKYICIILSAAIMISVLSFSACQKKENGEEKTTTSAATQTTRAATSAPVKIVDVPATTEEHMQMFNAALDFFELYCYQYTKAVKCEVSDVSVGSLSAASNASEAFKSIFGAVDKSNDYDYSTGQESFAENTIKSGFTSADIILSEAKQDGNDIILTVTFPNETNPSEKSGQLHKLTSEYVGVDKVNKSLDEFSSSAGSVSVSASDITAKVVLNSQDSCPKSITISFTERFSLSSVKLVQLEGSAVTGTSKTTVTYSNIK